MDLTEYQIQADAAREAMGDPRPYPSPYATWIEADIAPTVERYLAAHGEPFDGDWARYERAADLAALLWYVAVLATHHELALDEIATQGLERLAWYYPSPARDAGKGTSCDAE